MYDPSGSPFHGGHRHAQYYDSPNHHQQPRQQPEIYTPSSATTTGGGYFTDTPLESPMEELEPDWEPEPEMCPLPLITPPEMNLAAFQFPTESAQQQARSRGAEVCH
jgi:hypothetical protein